MAPSKNVHPVPFPVYVVAFTPKKSRIVAGGGGGQSNSGIANGVAVFALDEKSYTVSQLFVTDFGREEDACMTLAVHPKDKMVAAGINESSNSIIAGQNSNVRLLKFAQGCLERHRQYEHGSSTKSQDYVKVLIFSGDGSLLLAAGTDGKVSIFRYSSSQLSPLEFTVDHGAEIVDADLSPDGQMVVSASAARLLVTSPTSSKVFLDLTAVKFRKSVQCNYKVCKFGRSDTKDFLYVIVNTMDRKKAVLVRFTRGKWDQKKSTSLCSKAVTCGAISSCGQYLAFATNDFGIGFVYLKTLKVLKIINAVHTFAITSLAFHPTLPILVSGSADGSIAVRRVPKPTRFHPFIFILMSVVVVLLAYLFLWIVDPKFTESLFGGRYGQILGGYLRQAVQFAGAEELIGYARVAFKN